jgi:hypothetical protein
MRTRVYVDGYNLYYACLKGSAYKWLDPLALVRNQLPRNTIDMLRYFTARLGVIVVDRIRPMDEYASRHSTPPAEVQGSADSRYMQLIN